LFATKADIRHYEQKVSSDEESMKKVDKDAVNTKLSTICYLDA